MRLRSSNRQRSGGNRDAERCLDPLLIGVDTGVSAASGLARHRNLQQEVSAQVRKRDPVAGHAQIFARASVSVSLLREGQIDTNLRRVDGVLFYYLNADDEHVC